MLKPTENGNLQVVMRAASWEQGCQHTQFSPCYNIYLNDKFWNPKAAINMSSQISGELLSIARTKSS
jgi:hypothetical protein